MSEYDAPHCDSLVLHGPGECKFCDRYPDWQDARIRENIAFTGREPERFGTACPSTLTRTVDTINLWPGNRPVAEDSGDE